MAQRLEVSPSAWSFRRGGVMPEEEGGVRLRTMKTRPAPFPANEVTWRSTGLVSP